MNPKGNLTCESRWKVDDDQLQNLDEIKKNKTDALVCMAASLERLYL